MLTDDLHELITHIERLRAMLNQTREAVEKPVLADLVRYLEGKLIETAGGRPDL